MQAQIDEGKAEVKKMNGPALIGISPGVAAILVCVLIVVIGLWIAGD